MKIKIYILIITLALQSCDRLFTNDNLTVNDSILVIPNSIEYEFDTEVNDEPIDFAFPDSGSRLEDFNIDPENFEIQYEAYGDLNKDGLEDIVAVFAEKGDPTLQRATIVLLQNQNNTFRLDKISLIAFPPAYSEHDFKIYDSEEISIVDGILKIELYGSGGPAGNLFSHYKYNVNELEIIYIETYNIGAGAWQNSYYDVKKGELTQVVTNTMLEEMPTTENIFKIKNKTFLFETTSADQAIQDAFSKVEGNENW